MLEFSTITEARRALDARELSVVELTAHFLEKSEASSHGAWLTLCREEALTAAERADKALRGHTDAPHALTGIPYACKDNLVTKGIRTTCGSRMLANFVPPYDAAAVERLRDAGAVLLGKTNLDEFAMGSACDHSALGETVNPLDAACSPGGSSGGSAAAVAAGEALFALGTDTGGSARQPASFCGLVSMKPTYGLVSRWGLVEFAGSMDTVCPMTRTVADNRLVLAALAGHDNRDMTSLHLPDDWYRALSMPATHASGKGKKIAMAADLERFCDDATVRNTYRAAQLLRDAGYTVEEVPLPEVDKALAVYVILTAAESSSNLARYDGIRYGTTAEGESYREIYAAARTEGFGEEVTRRILTGAYALSAAHGGKYFHRIKNVQRRIQTEVEAVLAAYEGWLMPTTVSVAHPTDSGEKSNRYGSDRYTVYANLAGVPALQIPSGGDGHLPTGVSLIGRRYGESELYGIGELLEAAVKPHLEREVPTYGRI